MDRKDPGMCARAPSKSAAELKREAIKQGMSYNFVREVKYKTTAELGCKLTPECQWINSATRSRCIPRVSCQVRKQVSCLRLCKMVNWTSKAELYRHGSGGAFRT